MAGMWLVTGSPVNGPWGGGTIQGQVSGVTISLSGGYNTTPGQQSQTTTTGPAGTSTTMQTGPGQTGIGDFLDKYGIWIAVGGLIIILGYHRI